MQVKVSQRVNDMIKCNFLTARSVEHAKTIFATQLFDFSNTFQLHRIAPRANMNEFPSNLKADHSSLHQGGHGQRRHLVSYVLFVQIVSMQAAGPYDIDVF